MLFARKTPLIWLARINDHRGFCNTVQGAWCVETWWTRTTTRWLLPVRLLQIFHSDSQRRCSCQMTRRRRQRLCQQCLYCHQISCHVPASVAESGKIPDGFSVGMTHSLCNLSCHNGCIRLDRGPPYCHLCTRFTGHQPRSIQFPIFSDRTDGCAVVFRQNSWRQSRAYSIKPRMWWSSRHAFTKRKYSLFKPLSATLDP